MFFYAKYVDDLEYLPENYKEGLVNSFKNEIKTITKNLDARVAKAVKDLPTVWPESEKEVVEILKKMGVSTADQGVVTNFLKETIIRIITTILILAFGFKFINLATFIALFSCIYAIPTLVLLSNLIQSNKFLTLH